MKRAIFELVFIDSLFLFFLTLSSALDNAIGGIIYALAFILPFLLIALWNRRGEIEEYSISAVPTKKAFSLTLKLCFPTVFLIFSISFLTSLLTSFLGLEGVSAPLEGNPFFVILKYGLAPAIFEEMLFRYLPLRRLGSYSPRLAVFYSALFFSLVHASLLKIPYALLAGLIFAAIDIAAGSVLPSMIIHFINNLLSILWQREADNLPFVIVFLSVILLLGIVSVLCILPKRKSLKRDFSLILEDKSKFIFTYSFGIYLVAMIFVAFAECFV